MNIDRRIEAMRERVERSRPCRVTFTLKSGEVITTDPIGAWSICNDHTLACDVASVTADRDDYAEMAGVLAALCR